jgi:hypothetical protein
MAGVRVSGTLEIRYLCLVFIFSILCGVVSCLVLCHKSQNPKFRTRDSVIQDSEFRKLHVGVGTLGVGT